MERFLYLFPLRLNSVSMPLLVSVTKSSQKRLKEVVVYLDLEFDSIACQSGAMATGEAASWSQCSPPHPQSGERERQILVVTFVLFRIQFRTQSMEWCGPTSSLWSRSFFIDIPRCLSSKWLSCPESCQSALTTTNGDILEDLGKGWTGCYVSSGLTQCHLHNCISLTVLGSNPAAPS